MSPATFGKPAYPDSLKSAGIPEDQARAHAKAFDDALRDTVVTTGALRDELMPIKAGGMLLRRMVGFDSAATVAVIMMLLRH